MQLSFEINLKAKKISPLSHINARGTRGLITMNWLTQFIKHILPITHFLTQNIRKCLMHVNNFHS